MKHDEYQARSDAYNTQADEYLKLPDEQPALPNEYAPGADFNRDGMEYNPQTDTPPPEEEEKKRNRKILQYILASVAVVSVVVVSAVSTGQMQLPGTWLPPDTDGTAVSDAAPTDTADEPAGLRWDGDTLIYAYPFYTYPIKAGNLYRLSFDDACVDAYYDYLAGYIYALCQSVTDELLAQEITPQNRQNLLPLIVGLDVGGGDIIGGAYHYEDSLALFGVYYCLRSASIQESVTVQHNGDYTTTYTASGSGYVEMIDLSEDAACFDLPISPYNRIFGYGVSIRNTYAWGKDKTYAEIRAHLMETSTLDAPRTVSRTNPRVKEVLVTEGAAEIDVPTFIKVECFPQVAVTPPLD